MKTTRRNTFKLLGLPLALTAMHGVAAARHGHRRSYHAGKVFTMTNAAAGNELVVFGPDDDGGLAMLASAPTHGTGSGGGLGSQGAVTLSDTGRYVFVVNAGSNQLSTFVLRRRELRLASVVDSGGLHPISVTERDGMVVVLNDGGAGNIAGFRNDRGELQPIAGARRPLSAAGGTAPAQVSFSDDGDTLVVTEKDTHRLTTYRVRHDDRIGAPTVTAAAGLTPFGFAFDRRNRFFVSEAAGGAAGASSVSSYRLNGATPQVISASVATTQTAACWVALTPNCRYVYSANTGSQSVSSFRLERNGRIELIEAVAGNVGAGSTPVDAAVSADGQQLFVLDRGNRRIAVFDIDPDGSLMASGTSTGLPASVVGLTAN